MQPVGAETNEKRSGLRKPPKYEIKADNFQSIQLKPVSRDPKTPQKAENGSIDLKVFSFVKGILNIYSICIYIYICIYSLSLSHSFSRISTSLYLFLPFFFVYVTCWILIIEFTIVLSSL